MPRARKHLVCLEDTPYYHVTSRCVRRAFLCGYDRIAGTSYEHRRGWIEDRIRALSSLFSIEVCAYAVMSNHYHLVVKINQQEPDEWSDDEVLDRWSALFKGPLLVQRYREGIALSEAEQLSLRSIASVFRSRLGSLSWFMKCLNEPIARKANAEDKCTGHFWEARFHSQALCSDKALLTAMAYVDLNPIRAKVAVTPESSDFTSIKARLQGTRTARKLKSAIKRLLDSADLIHFNVPARPLASFARKGATTALPIREQDYFRLVDETGRITAQGKRGRIDPNLSPILERIGLTVDEWQQETTAIKRLFRKGEASKKRTA